MKILVLYYSQSGQLKQILDSLLEPLETAEDVSIHFEALKPKPEYPFPWTTDSFCDVFPESFQEIACEMEPLGVDSHQRFDLVILAYTVWYLSPAIPISSFLQSSEARQLLKDRPVVTVIGCRNMWLMAQEKVKKRIEAAGGRLKGNIVLMDHAANLVGVATIAYWMMTGKKERPMRLLPRPGVSDEDIREARRFGPLLRDPEALEQRELNALGAVRVVPTYIVFEQRIEKVFNIWSNFIRQKGGPGDPRRRKRVRMFFYYLLVAIVLIAPLATVAGSLIRRLKKDRIQAAVDYFSKNELKSGN
jgi:hypothetical protein